MNISSLLLSIFAVLSIFQIGFVIDYYIVTKFRSSSNIFIFFALGIGSIAVLQLFLGLIEISITRVAFFCLSILVFIPIATDQKARIKLADTLSFYLRHYSKLHLFIKLFIPFAISLLIIFTFSHTIWGSDAYVFWLSKARAFWVDGKITNNNIHYYWPQDHPLLWPLTATYFYYITGSGEGLYFRIIPLITYLSTIGIFMFLPAENKLIKSMWIIMLAFTPFLWANTVFNDYAGNADLMLSFYFLLSMYSLVVLKNGLYTALFLSFAILTKNDAIPALLCYIFILLLFILFKYNLKYKAISLIIAIGFLLFNIAWKSHFQLSNQFINQNITSIIKNRPLTKYIWYTLQSFREEFRQLRNWGIGWFVIIFSLSMNIKKVLQSKLILFSYLLIAAQLVSYIAIYSITPYDQASHIATSLYRLVLQLYPSLLFLSYMLWLNRKRISI